MRSAISRTRISSGLPRLIGPGCHASESIGRAVDEVGDVLGAPGKEVINADHVMALLDKPGAQVRSEKAGTTGDEDPGHGRDACNAWSGARKVSTSFVGLRFIDVFPTAYVRDRSIHRAH
jgi:hypothetical protein